MMEARRTSDSDPYLYSHLFDEDSAESQATWHDVSTSRGADGANPHRALQVDLTLCTSFLSSSKGLQSTIADLHRIAWHHHAYVSLLCGRVCIHAPPAAGSSAEAPQSTACQVHVHSEPDAQLLRPQGAVSGLRAARTSPRGRGNMQRRPLPLGLLRSRSGCLLHLHLQHQHQHQQRRQHQHQHIKLSGHRPCREVAIR